MAIQTVFALGASNISVSDGQQLSGITQGSGAHLVDPVNPITITLTSNSWEAISIDDDDANFNDNDGNQRLNGAQTFDGIAYDDNRVVESEYALTVTDPDGVVYRLLAFNIREPGTGSSFGTVEGLVFVDTGNGFPPIGVPLTVIDNFEFPSDPYVNLAAPPCFTAGTLLKTPDGDCLVEELAIGDWVLTLDCGPQQVRWTGVARIPQAALQMQPKFRPVVIRRDAFGPGQPDRDMRVSPQHRIFISGWRAELMFGEPEILVPAIKLVNDETIVVDHAAAQVVYYHIMFDDHQIVTSNGLLTESYLPGLMAEGEAATLAELDRLLPDAPRRSKKTARPCISDKRTVVLTPDIKNPT